MQSKTHSPEEGLRRLQEGNQRFVKETLLHSNRSKERGLSLVETQSPYAIIVTCSDSRIVPEVIFDEGVGDLFVIRVAGNVIGSIELESITFAVVSLQPAVIVVMGHENCGAVEATIKGKTQDVPTIAAYIQPSVEKAKSFKTTTLLKTSTEHHALNMCSLLLQDPVIYTKVEAKSLAVHAAYYNMQTGMVTFLQESSD